MKMLSRKFAVPTLASLLTLVNDAAGMGFDFKTMCLIVASSLAYAGIQCFYDIAALKYKKA